MKKIVFTLLISLMLVMVLTASVFAAPTSQEVAPVIELTPALLGSIAGVMLSLVFSYVPGLNVKFAALAPEIKRLVMLFVLLVTSLALYGLTCEKVIDTGLTCDRAGVMQLITVFITALVSNQSTYSISPLPQSVKAAASAPPIKPLDEHDATSYG